MRSTDMQAQHVDTDPESCFKAAVALNAIAEQTEVADCVYQVILLSTKPLKPPRVPAVWELEKTWWLQFLRPRKCLIYWVFPLKLEIQASSFELQNRASNNTDVSDHNAYGISFLNLLEKSKNLDGRLIEMSSLFFSGSLNFIAIPPYTNHTMGDPSTSSQRRRTDNAQRDDAAADAGAMQRDDTATNAGAAQTPDAGPATSACDLLRPLSSGSFPVPNSGSLAWLARQQSQHQITTPRISATREESLQSDSGSGATVESFGRRESPPRSAGQQEANQSTPGSTSPPPKKSADEYDGQPQQHVISPSPYASIFSEGTDPTTPLVLRRCDEHENTNDDPVRKYSESLQLFRRNEEDQDKTWKRRVVEYR